MKHRRVVTTPEADEDARKIDRWWIRNRGAAPNLYHLYFVYTEELVVIVGIWGATRRSTPRFRDRAQAAEAALASRDDDPGTG
ncbi:MAG TPA: hypothetical protein VFK02_21825 [Kofleriaceae bacterium]|nr:hypothetical protein [Kofleriaceae bacterium]